MILEIVPKNMCDIYPERIPAEVMISRVADKINSLPSDALITVLTGAGISVASGIPSFNSEGGLWSRFEKDRVASIEAFREDPTVFWRLFEEMYPVYSTAVPSRTHQAISELGRKRNLVVITQNIDGLHQQAGNEYVIELYGSPRTLVCIECGAERPLHYDPKTMRIQFSEVPPRCEVDGCNGLLKPGISFYGEDMPLEKRACVTSVMKYTDVLLAIGTSLRTTHSRQIVDGVMRMNGYVFVCKRRPYYHEYDGQILGNADTTIPKIVEKIHPVGSTTGV